MTGRYPTPMTQAKYHTTEHRRARKRIDEGQARGEVFTCAEVVCLMSSRDIEPHHAADVAHDPAGVRIIGASHARCNRSEGATRGNRARRPGPRRWLL